MVGLTEVWLEFIKNCLFYRVFTDKYPVWSTIRHSQAKKQYGEKAHGIFQYQNINRLRIGALAAFEMDIELAALRHNIRVAVMNIFAFVMTLPDGNALFPICLITNDCAVNLGHGEDSFIAAERPSFSDDPSELVSWLIRL